MRHIFLNCKLMQVDVSLSHVTHLVPIPYLLKKANAVQDALKVIKLLLSHCYYLLCCCSSTLQFIHWCVVYNVLFLIDCCVILCALPICDVPVITPLGRCCPVCPTNPPTPTNLPCQCFNLI